MVPSVATEKIPSVIPPGIDPETVRLVAQCLNHYATPSPKTEDIWRNKICIHDHKDSKDETTSETKKEISKIKMDNTAITRRCWRDSFASGQQRQRASCNAVMDFHATQKQGICRLWIIRHAPRTNGFTIQPESENASEPDLQKFRKHPYGLTLLVQSICCCPPIREYFQCKLQQSLLSLYFALAEGYL
jgi:hypothetical protein